MENTLIGSRLGIFSNKSGNYIKSGSVKFAEKDFLSENSFMMALQKAMHSGNGIYTVRNGSDLFARFTMENDRVVELHNRSQYTGIRMPCWNFLK